MLLRNRRWLAVLAGAAAVAVTALLTLGSGSADAHSAVRLSSIAANQKAAGVSVPNGLAPQLRAAVVAQGANAVENPTDWAAFYGYNNNGTLLPLAGTNAEASKTEPDKNTYLVLRGQHGADPDYDYGTHFLYQGHETGLGGYVTRINLDADPAHRVTVLATRDVAGKPLPVFDGSVWDPFGRTLLMTAELGASGGVWQLQP